MNLVLTGCGSTVEQPPAQPRLTSLNRDQTLSLRCRLVDAPPARAMLGSSEKILAVGDGPYGTFWATSSWVYDDRGRTANQLPTPEALGMLGRRKLLTLTAGQLRVHESFSDAGRILRAIPNACDFRVHSTESGAFVVYRQARQGCAAPVGGTLELLKIDLTGNRVEVLHPVGQAVGRLESRWENGRFLLAIDANVLPTANDFTAWRTLVMDSEGTVLNDGRDGYRVCPLSGCLSLTADTSRALRFLVDRTSNPFDLTAPAGTFNAMASNGNRVLLVNRVNNSEEYHFMLIDSIRRRAESIYNDSSHSFMETWTDRIASESLRIRATDRGFAYIAINMQGELVKREIDCM